MDPELLLVSAPVLFSCHFGGGQFTELARVLAWTAARHCPLWQRRVVCISGHTMRAAEGAYADNTHKLDRWNEFVQLQPEGTRILLIDADTFISRSLDAIWDRDFDIAYTVRPAGYKLPLNGGVLFLRVNARSKAFIAAWAEANRRMLIDRPFHMKWRKRYGGINQAALGCVLTTAAHGLAIEPLPCLEWNCEDSGWESFDPEVTRIVHVKSRLRLVVFNMRGPTPAVRRVAKLWRALDRDAVGLPA